MAGPSIRQRLSATRGAVQAAVVNQAAHVFARMRYALPDAHPEKHDVVVHHDVAYAEPGDVPHRLDVYIPAQSVRADAGRDVRPRRRLLDALEGHAPRDGARLSRARGYLVFNINYRLGPRHLYPAPLEDACAALLWVHERCAEYGGDPNRLAIAGESAGGNLVTALAVAHASRRPEPFARAVFDANLPLRAVVATYRFLDLDRRRPLPPPPADRVLGARLLRDAAVFYVGHDIHGGVEKNPLSSPLRILERDFRPPAAAPAVLHQRRDQRSAAAAAPAAQGGARSPGHAVRSPRGARRDSRVRRAWCGARRRGSSGARRTSSSKSTCAPRRCTIR